jgi:hypothetical protein
LSRRKKLKPKSNDFKLKNSAGIKMRLKENKKNESDRHAVKQRISGAATANSRADLLQNQKLTQSCSS